MESSLRQFLFGRGQLRSVISLGVCCRRRFYPVNSHRLRLQVERLEEE